METKVLLVAAAFAAMVLLSIVAARRLPKGAMVPMQWGLTGKPTWRAPVWFAVFFTPILAALVLALMVSLTFVSEKARNDIEQAAPAVTVVFLVVHVLHLSGAFWHFAARGREARGRPAKQ